MTTETDDLEFANAFAAMTSGGNIFDDKGAVKTPEVLATEAAAIPAVVEPVVAPAAVVEPAAVVAEPAAVVDPVVTPAAVVDPVVVAEPAVETATAADKAEYGAMRAEIDALKQAQEKLATPAVEAKPVQVYSTDEQAVLTKYNEDWPDIAKAEALVRRAEYRELVAYVFQQMESKYAPALDYVDKRSGKDQYSDIVKLVPDYDAVRDKTLAWAATQPAYLKAAYEKVTTDGSPEDVADLISRFKKETAYKDTAVVSSTITPPVIVAPVVAPALSAAAKKAAEALAVVKTGRSEQTVATDDNDFDSAFAKYAEEEDKQRTRK